MSFLTLSIVVSIICIVVLVIMYAKNSKFKAKADEFGAKRKIDAIKDKIKTSI